MTYSGNHPAFSDEPQKRVRVTCFVSGLLLAISFCSAGCGGDGEQYPVPPAGAPSESVVTESKPFVIGTERYQADFGTITVPENRSTPTSRPISVPFLRIHSQSKNPAEPVFGLTGGPGQSNIKWDWGKASTFLSERDFVVVGYRGVDGSVVLDCPEVTEAFKAGSDVLGKESMVAIGRAWNASAERLKAQGVDLNGYTMLECIGDIESVRRAGVCAHQPVERKLRDACCVSVRSQPSGTYLPIGNDQRESTRTLRLGSPDD
jgi:hypothetical protein